MTHQHFLPHPEERLKGASRRMREEWFETRCIAAKCTQAAPAMATLLTMRF